MRRNILILVATSLISALAVGQSAPIQLYQGSKTYERLGSAVAAAGDVNGDGIPDFLYGAPKADWPSDPGPTKVYVRSGLDGSLLHEFSGAVTGDEYGQSVASAGDVNGDGFDDFLVGGGPFTASIPSPRFVELRSGSDGSLLYGYSDPPGTKLYGAAVAGVGDIDGDGRPDFAIGDPTAFAPSDPLCCLGRVDLHSGNDGSLIYSLQPPSMTLNSRFGSALTALGDLNLDGFADFAIGAPHADFVGPEAGSVFIISGVDGSTIRRLDGAASHDRFGRSVASAGDLDGDGLPDLLVGAPQGYGPNNQGGYVKAYSGADGACIRHVFGNRFLLEEFGAAVSGLPDTDGDGIGDLLVGAPGYEGAVWIISGRDGIVIDRIAGPHLNSGFGGAIASLGDTDLDGLAEFAVGSAKENVGPVFGAGGLRVYRGALRPVLTYDTSTSGHTDLDLAWLPAGGDPTAVLGDIVGNGATPGGAGLMVISLAKGDYAISGWLPLLVALGSNLIDAPTFGFDLLGALHLPSISRVHPAFAGVPVYLQIIEFDPVLASSNGLRLQLVP
ncbi:MAG: FG-GAP repeat protein [Planctomycetes bacterium]|nr:FG-GAP repeat protein [Planctomycetota bacterium]